MADLAVTDTHALVWFAAGAHRKLGRNARRVFERADAGVAAIYVPTIVLVEVAENVRVGRIELGRTYANWEAELFSAGKYLPVDLTREIVRAADRLYAIPERADRLIAATAVVLGCPLLTRDPAIGRVAIVEVVW